MAAAVDVTRNIFLLSESSKKVEEGEEATKSFPFAARDRSTRDENQQKPTIFFRLKIVCYDDFHNFFHGGMKP